MNNTQVQRTSYNVQSLGIIFILFLASLALFGGGCFGLFQKDKPIQQTQNAQNNHITVSQTDYKKFNEIKEQAPKGIAYLEFEPGAAITVTRGENQTTAKQGMALFAGDQVQVTGAEARLIYPEIGASKLAPGTNITILPAGEIKPGQGLGAMIVLEAGKIWTRLEKILEVGESFSVQADNVVATVRGTAFSVKKQDNQVGIQVAESTVKISTRDAMEYMAGMGNIPKDLGYDLNAGQEIKLEMDKFRELARIEPLPEGSFAYFDTDLYFENLFDEKIEEVPPEEMVDPEYEWMTEDLDESEMEEPDIPFYWDANPAIDDNYLMYMNPEMLAAWQEYQNWMQEHQAEILEAERIRAQMEASGMFNNPVIPPAEYYPPGAEPGSSGPSDMPPESIIYYDENGNPHYTDEVLNGTAVDDDYPPVVGYDDYGNPVYEEPAYDPDASVNNESIELLDITADPVVY
ncbi:MAG: FecR domain-containing protein [Patescibacteria group bacterium]